ncbi:MAG: IS3 family transposase, partial [Clostridiaceae bacterium]|nr:IS3 family transposase [Clostridiaceae bacterium]
RSMSKKGCSPDNAACEGFFGRMKVECFYDENFSSHTLAKFMKYLDQYLHWYNEKRIKMSLGGKSPLQYRQLKGIAV